MSIVRQFKTLAAAMVMVAVMGCIGVHINKGFKALNQSDYDRAIDEFTQEIQLGGPNKAIAYYMRGYTYAEKGDYHAAIADYSEAIRTDPKLTKQPNIFLQRGIAYARKGEYESAIGDFDKSINVSPTYAPAYYNRGLAYLDKKDYDKAISDLEACLRINPNNKEAKEKLEIAKMGEDGVLPTSASAAPAAKTAAVDDELDIVIRHASNYLNENIPKGSKIVILNIESKSAILSDYVINELIANAVNDKKFYVVDRRQLEAIQSEQKFQMSGAVDDKDALAIGKFFGAQIIVSGSIQDIGSRYRLTVQALSVQTAQVQGQYNRNIAVSKILTDLVDSKR